MEKETKNILNRQYTSLVLYFFNKKGQPKEYCLIDKEGDLHYGKPCVDACHWEYDNYDRLIWDLERKSMPKEMLEILFLKKRLFSKKKDVYECCDLEDTKIDRKSFMKIVFNQEYKEDKNCGIHEVVKYLSIEELFSFAQDYCEDLKCCKAINKYINKILSN